MKSSGASSFRSSSFCRLAVVLVWFGLTPRARAAVRTLQGADPVAPARRPVGSTRGGRPRKSRRWLVPRRTAGAGFSLNMENTAALSGRDTARQMKTPLGGPAHADGAALREIDPRELRRTLASSRRRPNVRRTSSISFWRWLEPPNCPAATKAGFGAIDLVPLARDLVARVGGRRDRTRCRSRFRRHRHSGADRRRADAGARTAEKSRGRHHCATHRAEAV